MQKMLKGRWDEVLTCEQRSSEKHITLINVSSWCVELSQALSVIDTHISEPIRTKIEMAKNFR